TEQLQSLIYFLFVEPGEDAVLTCQAPSGAAVTVVKWTTDGHPADEYLLLYRNSRSYDNHQPEAYRGRVVLKNPAVARDGDFSVVLKNVSMEDTGTYRCLVLMSTKNNVAEHLVVIRLRTAMPSGTSEIKRLFLFSSDCRKAFVGGFFTFLSTFSILENNLIHKISQEEKETFVRQVLTQRLFTSHD
uniref:Ig-like domain-containing protein n=1 Tax=Fundulus heteroclitus TaxID=8078 RepID=A0A3Q2QF27_FUNHE